MKQKTIGAARPGSPQVASWDLSGAKNEGNREMLNRQLANDEPVKTSQVLGTLFDPSPEKIEDHLLTSLPTDQ